MGIVDLEVFGRDAELNELRGRLRANHSFLMYGGSGVGKTLLIKKIAPEFRRLLYCPDSETGESVFRSLALQLLKTGNPMVRHACGRGGELTLKTKSVLALRGLVLEAIHAGKYWVVLDHLCRTSAGLASDIREIMFRGDTPVLAIARSHYMEDLGFLASFFTLRQERMQIRPFNRELTAAFALQTAKRYGLYASNFDEFLQRVVDLSAGSPGHVISLIKMAKLPKYRAAEYVKVSPLYIDFRLAWHAANAY